MKRHTSLSETIAESIKNDIIKGIWKPGDRLPGEYELANYYEVSRFTVREAIKRMSSTGLVTVEHGIGTFVNTVAPDSYMKPLLPLIALSDTDMLTICEARQPIEVQSIALCTMRATDDDILKMKDIYRQMQEVMQKEDYDAYHQIDLAFHKTIAQASRNMIIYTIMEMLQDFLRAQMTEVFSAPNSKMRSLERHRAMIEAIEERNVEMGKLLMSQHIQDSIDYMIEKQKNTEHLIESDATR
jgi:GntR family transcriptional repressor for pyruvate dehydrogenase complex